MARPAFASSSRNTYKVVPGRWPPITYVTRYCTTILSQHNSEETSVAVIWKGVSVSALLDLSLDVSTYLRLTTVRSYLLSLTYLDCLGVSFCVTLYQRLGWLRLQGHGPSKIQEPTGSIRPGANL